VNLRMRIVQSALVGAFALSVPSSAWAQADPFPFRVITGAELQELAPQSLTAGQPQTVRVPEAEWLQIVFSNFELGAGTLKIENLLNGDVQNFTQAELESWSGASAVFDGDAVRISVTGESASYEIAEVVVGEPRAELFTDCGADDRVASADVRVGRLFPTGCTGWIVGQNTFLAAGHCFFPSSGPNADPGQASQGRTMLQFNVPTSNPNRTTNSPAVRDQYPVVRTSVVGRNSGIGFDFAVYSVMPNTETGLLPRDVQGDFFQLATTTPPTGTRLTVVGFGSDDGAANQTQQEAFGTLTRRTPANRISYNVDTRGGNSGSPVVDVNSDIAIGIHTHGGCRADGGGANSGTSTLYQPLVDAFLNSVNLNGR
jgi:V8-like Glu-specific endopeptidase